MNPEEQLARDIWAWLPTFRTLAETEHMPTASRRLHITTSAISRTLGLLEDRLGHPLFNRVGRRLVLNTLGERLLRSVQVATREIEATLHTNLSDPFDGRLYVSAIGVLSNEVVVPALLTLRRDHPSLHPILQNHRPVEAHDLLLRGQIDVAFYYEAIDHPDVHVEHIGHTTASVFCGRSHPLYNQAEISLDDLQAHPFSVPMIGDSGQVMDGWPIDQPRQIGMQITLLRSNLAVCLSGQMLTVLPDITALSHWQSGDLRRLPFDQLPPIKVYAARPRGGHPHGAASALIEAARHQLQVLAHQTEHARST